MFRRHESIVLLLGAVAANEQLSHSRAEDNNNQLDIMTVVIPEDNLHFHKHGTEAHTHHRPLLHEGGSATIEVRAQGQHESDHIRSNADRQHPEISLHLPTPSSAILEGPPPMSFKKDTRSIAAAHGNDHTKDDADRAFHDDKTADVHAKQKAAFKDAGVAYNQPGAVDTVEWRQAKHDQQKVEKQANQVKESWASEQGANLSPQESTCFAGHSLVRGPSGEMRQLRDVHVGDSVLTSVGFEPVIGFLHTIGIGASDFQRIEHDSGVLFASNKHRVFTPHGKTIFADSVQPGQTLATVAGTTTVKKVQQVSVEDFAAPLTASGTIVVDGVAASTYADAIPHWLAHWMLTPVRWAFQFSTGVRHAPSAAVYRPLPVSS